MHRKAILSLIIANIIWGASSPIFKWSLENIPVFTLAFFRFFVASFILLPFALKRGIGIKRADFPLVALLGLAMFFHISFYFLGLKFAPSINAPIIASSGPILLILLSRTVLNEHLKDKVILGTLLSLLGVLVIMFRSFLEQPDGTGEVLGNFFIVLATILAVTHALLGKRVLSDYPAISITWWYFLLSGIGFAVLMATEVKTAGFLSQLDIRGLTGIIFGVVFASVLAHSLYIWGIAKIAAHEIGIFSYIDPVAAVVIATPLLGERITLPFLLGSLLVFLGIFIAEGRIHYHPIHKLKALKPRTLDSDYYDLS